MAGAEVTQDVFVPVLPVSAAQLSAWKAAGANHLRVDVRQAGTFSASLPAQITVQI